MGCSYFFILAYLLREVAQVAGRWDTVPLTVACSVWSMLDALRVIGSSRPEQQP
jgi:hypothetical protein